MGGTGKNGVVMMKTDQGLDEPPLAADDRLGLVGEVEGIVEPERVLGPQDPNRGNHRSAQRHEAEPGVPKPRCPLRPRLLGAPPCAQVLSLQ